MAAELLTDASRATDSNSNPYSGAKWSFYASGTTTPQSVYADAALNSSLGAIVTADAGGKFVPIYFDSALSYRGVLKSADGSVTIYDIDPINTGAARLLSDFLKRTGSPEAFGVFDDPNFKNAGSRTDQSTALQAWLTYAAANGVSPNCNRPIRAYSSAALTYDPGTIGQSPDLLLGNLRLSVNGAGLTIGAITGTIDSIRCELPSVHRTAFSWSGNPHDTNVAGIRLINIRFSDIVKGDVRGYAVGHQWWSQGFGIYGNTIRSGISQDNRIDDALICSGAGSFINDNTWAGGATSLSSGSVSMAAAFVCGVYFGYTNSGYRGNNNNRFFGRCFESGDTASYPNIVEAIPVWFEGSGGYNYFDEWRCELWDGPAMHVSGDVNGNANAIYGLYNEFRCGLFQNFGAAAGRMHVRQVNGAYGNIVTGPPHSNVQSWNSGPLRDLLWAAGAAGIPRTCAPYILREGVDGTNRRQTTFTGRAETNIHGQQWNNGGPGLIIDTTRHKNFELTKDTLPGNDGRWFFAGYDASGALMGDTSTDGYGTERNIKFPDASPTSIYGGGMITGTDGAQPMRVTVRDEVKSLFIMPASGTLPMVINGFSVKTLMNVDDASGAFASAGPMILDPLIDGLPGARFASANPSTAGTNGLYSRGEEVMNIAATSGQPKGWTCTTGGALGLTRANSTSYSVKGQVLIWTGTTDAYAVVTPGTSGAGAAPVGPVVGNTYTDGSLVLRYIGPKAVFTALENL